MSAQKAEEKKKLIFSRPGTSANLTMGIVGLPNVGKSTFFNRLTDASVPAENYPYCTINPSIGQVKINDPRVKFLQQVYQPKKVVHASLNVVDIAGLMKGASEGEGLGNQFLDHIRNVDGIFLVVRCFEDKSITHVIDNTVDPVRDIAIIKEELRLKDKEWVGKNTQREEHNIRANPGVKEYVRRMELSKELEDVLESEWIAEWEKAEGLCEKDVEYINSLNLLTTKGVIILANISARHYAEKKGNKHLKALFEVYGKDVIPFSAEQLEKESSEPFPEVFLDKIVERAFDVLGLMNFFTAGKDEVKSWTVRRGSKAPDAGAAIHSDFKKYFICAEVMNYGIFEKNPSESQMRAKGAYLQKGKDYVVENGDIIFFKQNAPRSGKK